MTISGSVTNIGAWAFTSRIELGSAYFQGNAPSVNGWPSSEMWDLFLDESGAVYYVPGTSGWSSNFGGWPTALWYQPEPQILGGSYGLGVQSNQFNFTVSWATNTSMVIEACTNLTNPVWVPLTTNLLANGTNYFSDSQWTNFPNRC